ncbi:hypothetical protein RND71_025109 [Anisodus tanguticus]|uniref:Uncharacterized protein n=1 Tax=Anisodus tanguticus TaxID=243964 RepID=A0AAE1V4J2_9SOLA|nr:hypothetical protein RND71_025109 [Anisodus tanguticus]
MSKGVEIIESSNVNTMPIEEEEYIVTVNNKIIELQKYFSWYYISCNACSKKIVPANGVYRCHKCNNDCKFPLVKQGSKKFGSNPLPTWKHGRWTLIESFTNIDPYEFYLKGDTWVKGRTSSEQVKQPNMCERRRAARRKKQEVDLLFQISFIFVLVDRGCPHHPSISPPRGTTDSLEIPSLDVGWKDRLVGKIYITSVCNGYRDTGEKCNQFEKSKRWQIEKIKDYSGRKKVRQELI